jgi:hypothetical protein
MEFVKLLTVQYTEHRLNSTVVDSLNCTRYPVVGDADEGKGSETRMMSIKIPRLYL